MSNPTVFLVDTDTGSLDRLNEILTDAGYSPVLWWESTRAHDLVREIQPALVLLERDLELPGDGLGVLAQLRADPTTARIPVMLMAHDAGVTAGDGELPAGSMPRLLVKPLEVGQLVEAVAEALGSEPLAPRGQSRTAMPGGDRRGRRSGPLAHVEESG